jgi:hypothetical protein
MHIDTNDMIAVDTRTAATFLGVSKSHLEKLRIDDPENSPPYFRVGKCARYSLAGLKEWSHAG